MTGRIGQQSGATEVGCAERVVALTCMIPHEELRP